MSLAVGSTHAERWSSVSEAKSEGVIGGVMDIMKKMGLAHDVPDDPPKVVPVAKARASQAPLPPTTMTPERAPVAADPAVKAKLEGILQASLPPVYATWMEKYQQLAEVIPDDAMRFKAALKTSNATPAQLSAAVDQLLGAMTKAHDEFTRGFEGQIVKVEGTAKETIASTEALILSRRSQLEAIHGEIASLESKRATEASHLQDEQRRLDGIRLGFEAAHAQVVGSLAAQKSHIDSMARG